MRVVEASDIRCIIILLNIRPAGVCAAAPHICRCASPANWPAFHQRVVGLLCTPAMIIACLLRSIDKQWLTDREG